jgi:hypothetical protein
MGRLAKRELVELLDLALDALDLAEVRREHGVDETGHERTRVEQAQLALAADLLAELAYCREGTVVDGDDEVLPDHDVQLAPDEALLPLRAGAVDRGEHDSRPDPGDG